MSGIGDYFDGERGEVVRFAWIPGSDAMTYRMELRNDPHRRYARDYGSDIAIDPALAPGDTAVYIRRDAYSGVWLREQDSLTDAFARACAHRRRFIDPVRNHGWLALPWAVIWIPLVPGVPLRLR